MKPIIIICNKELNYKNYLDEKTIKVKCKHCKADMICGDLVIKRAKKKYGKKVKLEFVCNECSWKEGGEIEDCPEDVVNELSEELGITKVDTKTLIESAMKNFQHEQEKLRRMYR